ncbi:MAG: AarF/ABC1/UbiB kinase family protein [Verrucomicrobiae bacterium]|nr:AarF/ABC1/UbiB kinase family protein [Verrucomicrobiae bacterium]
MRLNTLVRIDKSARRLAEILATLAKYGLADWLSGIDYDWLKNLVRNSEGDIIPNMTTAERIRCALTDLGPTFIKVGQILSSRPDLIGPDLTDELAKLQAQTKPDPWEWAKRSIESELGHSVEDLFRSIDETPVASASIGQVHEAVLRDGREVVVKVMHEGIEETVRRDLELLLGLAELAEKHSSQLRRFQPLATARYFQRTLLRELDFNYERRHLERFAEDFANDPTVHFPAAYPEFCSEGVLTLERLHGVPVSHLSELKAVGTDLNEFAKRGGNLYLEMVFGHGFYHADPHPGNLFRLEGDVIGVIDCGMVGSIDEALREDIEGMLLSAVSHDADGLTESIVRVGQVPPELDEDELRAEVGEFLSDYVGQSVAEFDVGGALQRLFGLVRDFHIVLPQSFGMLVKTLVVLEGTAKQLSPDFSLAAMIQPYYQKALRRRFRPGRLAAGIGRGYRDWKRLLEILPRDLSDILSRFRKGTFEVHMEHRRLEGTVDRLVLGLLTAAVFLGSAIMWSMKAPPTVWGVSLFGALGFLTSVWLGAGLLISIRRAKKKQGPS